VIYIVTSGSYSDYGIIAAFTNKKAAEAFVQAYNSNDNGDPAIIEEYEEGPSDKLFIWKVYYETMEGSSAAATMWMGKLEEGVEINKVMILWPANKHHKSTQYGVVVRAEDAPSAIKAGVEMIQRFRATTPGAM